jgi:ABC-type molybdate transport system substrate-binding protein
MSGGALQEVLAALTPEFEKQTGHKVTFFFAVITAL